MKRKLHTYEILLFGYLGSYLIHYFTDLSFNITYTIWTFFGVSCGVYLFSKKIYNKILLNSGIIYLFAFTASLMNGGHSAFNVAILLNTQMFGLLIYDKRAHLRNLAKFCEIFIYCLLVISFMTPKTLVNASQGQYAVVLSQLVGGNTISIFLILFLSIDLYWRKNEKLPLNYVPFFVSLIIAFHNGGNGGVVSLSAFLLGVIFIDWRTKRLSLKKTLTFCGVALAVILYKGYQTILIEYLTDDNSRFWMWSHYYECAISSVNDFVLGAKVEGVPFLAMQRNLHNTFLNWHYYYGLIPFIIYIVQIINLIIRNIIRKDFLQLIILGVLFIRGMTDEGTFCLMTVWMYIYAQSRYEK